MNLQVSKNYISIDFQFIKDILNKHWDSSPSMTKNPIIEEKGKTRIRILHQTQITQSEDVQ